MSGVRGVPAGGPGSPRVEGPAAPPPKRPRRGSSGVGERRLLALTAVALAVGIAYVSFQELGPSAVYYLTPTEAREKGLDAGATARLGGMVEPGSLSYDEATRDLRFIMTDGVTRIVVIGEGAPPALLREGAGAVVEGRFAPDRTFRADQVIAKHDEVYVAPGPGQTPPHRTP